MLTSLIYRLFMLCIGILYPAFSSYKALKQNDQKQCISCLQYWVVISFFITAESVSDLFLSWLPFYYAFKVLLILMMLSTPGTKMAYKQLIHPKLKAHEKNIDNLITQTRDSGYDVLMQYRDRGLKYASDLFLNTAVLGSTFWDRKLASAGRSHSEERNDYVNFRIREASSEWQLQNRAQSLDIREDYLDLEFDESPLAHNISDSESTGTVEEDGEWVTRVVADDRKRERNQQRADLTSISSPQFRKGKGRLRQPRYEPSIRNDGAPEIRADTTDHTTRTLKTDVYHD